MTNIDAEIGEIRERHRSAMREEVQKHETAYYQQKFPEAGIEVVSCEGGVYAVNDVRLAWAYDKYLNGRFEWMPTVPPVVFLPVFADMIVRHEKRRYSNSPYCYRLVQGMLIDLADSHYKNYSGQEMFEILKLADQLPVERNNRERNGFRAWLLETAYTAYTNYRLDLREWSGKAEFQKLLAASEGE